MLRKAISVMTLIIKSMANARNLENAAYMAAVSKRVNFG